MHDVARTATDDADQRVRLHVHVALASVVLAFVAPLVGWGLWIADRRAPPGPWRRRLLGLAIVDTVLVVSLAAATAAGIDLDRSVERVEVAVAPEVSAPAPDRARGSLFEPLDVEQVEQIEAPRAGRRFVAAARGLELVMIAGLAVAARRRRTTTRPAFVVLGGLLVLSLASTAVLLAFAATVGLSLGAFLLALLAGSTALLLVGLGGARLSRRPPVCVGPTIGTAEAIVLGVFYGIAGALRIAVALALLVAVFDFSLYTAAETFRVESSWGPAGLGIFVVTTVIVAPVAEELVFRGVLLPWLARWMRPGAALAWSALVFAIGHLYYGIGAALIAYYGVVFGWARLRTGRLWAPVALHSLLNGLTVLALITGKA